MADGMDQRIADLLALAGRHGAEIANGSGDHAATIWRKLRKLPVNLPRLLLLLRGQMLPGFHAVQDALLLLWRKIRKMLQPLAQHLLALRRETPKARIVLQCPLSLS